jgi:hypothetical protein
MLQWQPEIVVFLWGKNDLKALLALGVKHQWISFEPLGRFS